MSITMKMSKSKSVDRVLKELKESVSNLEKLSDKEIDLVPDKWIKKMFFLGETISAISDMIVDMEYEE